MGIDASVNQNIVILKMINFEEFRMSFIYYLHFKGLGMTLIKEGEVQYFDFH